MVSSKQQIPAGLFKAKCLSLMDQVNATGKTYIITKHGQPVCALVPIVKSKVKSYYGCMDGTLTIVDDIIKPLDDTWNANE